jgi:TRAP-type C4-dicarboxylate transport system permease large subunit
MSFAPTSRLLRLTGALAVPLAGVGGLFPALAAPSVALLAVLALVVAWDAYRGRRQLEAVRITCPETVRLTKNVAAALPLTIENGLPAAPQIKLAPRCRRR